MDKIDINVVENVLKSTMALHDFGQPVDKYINAQLATITKPVLIVVNLRGVNPMDYEFVNIAFSKLINLYQNNENVYIVFKVDKWELLELYTGLLDILGLKAENEDDEKDVLIKNKFALIYVNENNETNYLCSLGDVEMNVLKKIEEAGKIASNDIQAHFSLSVANAYKILENLSRCKFVYQTDQDVYSAIKSLI